MILIVMGVSGSGKSTIGRLLASRLSLPFFDADDFHSPGNIEKMRQGVPLTDADRAPWLQRLAALLAEEQHRAGAVLACSALRESYRHQLQQQLERPPVWIFLEGDEALLRQRLGDRPHHFMNRELLASQLETLEPPSYGIRMSIDQDPEAIVNAVLEKLQAR